MKLTHIAENTAIKTPEEVMLAALASVQVRDSYVKASQQDSTKSDVLKVLYGIGAAPNDPDVVAMQKAMQSTVLQSQAAKMITWVRNQKVNPNDDFLYKAQSIIAKNAINERQVGFVVGTYPFYTNKVGQLDQSGNMIQRTWPPEWDEVEMLWKKPVIVTGVNQVQGSTGDYQRVSMIMDHKYMFSWALNPGATAPKKGQTFEVTGYLKPGHDNTIRFVPNKSWAVKAKKSLGIGDRNERDDEGESINPD